MLLRRYGVGDGRICRRYFRGGGGIANLRDGQRVLGSGGLELVKSNGGSLRMVRRYGVREGLSLGFRRYGRYPIGQDVSW